MYESKEIVDTKDVGDSLEAAEMQYQMNKQT